MKDFLGHSIEIGHTICWPVRRGAKMWLARGSVTDVSAREVQVVKDDTGRATRLKNFNTIVSMGGVVL